MCAISGVGSAATSAYPVAQATKPPVKTSPNPTPVATTSSADSDGDNDGSSGIDVSA
jgi:hypothetical protein